MDQAHYQVARDLTYLAGAPVSFLWALSVLYLRAHKEWHHYWLGALLMAVGAFLGHSMWLGVPGLLLMVDDAWQHFRQALGDRDYRSPLHLLYRHLLYIPWRRWRGLPVLGLCLLPLGTAWAATTGDERGPTVLLLPAVRQSLAARWDSLQVSLESEEDALCLNAREVPMPPGYTLFIVTSWEPATIHAYSRDTTAGRRMRGVTYECFEDQYALHTHSELHARWIDPNDRSDWYRYPSLTDWMTALRFRERMALIQWSRDGFTAYSNTYWPQPGDTDGQR